MKKMKKIIYSLLTLGFLVSCSSGGSDSPSPLPSDLIIGDWSLNELEVYQRQFNYLPNGNTNTIVDTSYVLNYDQLLEQNFFMTYTFQDDGTVIEQLYDDELQGITTETTTWLINDNSELVVGSGLSDSYPLTITSNTFTLENVSDIDTLDNDTYFETNLDMTFIRIENDQRSNFQYNNSNTSNIKFNKSLFR